MTQKSNSLLLSILLSLFLAQSAYAQNKESALWLGLRTGRSYSPINDFPVWAETEGLNNIPSGTSHRMITFDIGYQKNRIPLYFTTEINLPELNRTYPYLTSISLESGYVIFDQRAKLTALMGPSLGIMTVRFRQGVPDSFRNLPYNHSDAFARAYILMLRGSLLANYPLADGDSKWGKIILVANLGFQHSISHGQFWYGENRIVPDDRFVGERVDMARFFKRNMWVSVGFGYKAW
ncbi:MAG: hypothetical protein JJU28_06600 [Cyclobacteriaceae bacterium]|nr:hypothetical protein [Cyclobacteriaceae bacterium]